MARAAGGGDVGVDVADRDRDALGQAGPRRRPRRSARRRRAERRRSAASSLSRRSRRTPGRARRGSPGRGSAVLADPLVAGGAGVADVARRQSCQTIQSAASIQRSVALVDLRVLLEHLQRLGELPLGGDLPAVARAARARRARRRAR